MDNTSNCNKLAELLPNYIPSFQEMEMQKHCMAHILNLIAKVHYDYGLAYLMF
jgi:hypothetical protein